MSTSSVSKPSFEVSLIGRWEPCDPYDPRPEAREVLSELAAYGLRPEPLPDGARLLLATTMIDLDETVEPAVPIFASLVVAEHPGGADAELTASGEIIPRRTVRERSVNWPDPAVGTVVLHEVTYVVPYPDGPLHVIMRFTTPNLPRKDELEWLFDTIVGTSRWIEPHS